MDVDRKAVAVALALANARTRLFSTGPVPVETVREAGWYWVRFDGDALEIAEWDTSAYGGCWWRVGRHGVAVGVPVVLSPRLTPPGPGAVAPEPAPRVRVRWGVPIGDASDGGAP